MNWLGSRAVGRPENPEGGHNLSLLVEIGLTDLPKSGDGHGTPVSDRPGKHYTFIRSGNS